MLKKRRLAIASGVPPVFPDSLGGWRDPSNVRRIWWRARDDAGIEGLVSHTLRKTVASFLDDAAVPTRKISDQLGHSRVSMTQDHYLGRKLTEPDRRGPRKVTRIRRGMSPKVSQEYPLILFRSPANRVYLVFCGPPGDRTQNPRIKSPLLCQLS